MARCIAATYELTDALAETRARLVIEEPVSKKDSVKRR